MTRAAILSALILGITMPALAEKQVWKVGEVYVIRTHDLDLGSSEGRMKLLARVESASRRLCSEHGVATERRTCAARARDQVLGEAPGALRAALAHALRERSQVQLAKRW